MANLEADSLWTSKMCYLLWIHNLIGEKGIWFQSQLLTLDRVEHRERQRIICCASKSLVWYRIPLAFETDINELTRRSTRFISICIQSNYTQIPGLVHEMKSRHRRWVSDFVDSRSTHKHNRNPYKTWYILIAIIFSCYIECARM